MGSSSAIQEEEDDFLSWLEDKVTSNLLEGRLVSFYKVAKKASQKLVGMIDMLEKYDAAHVAAYDVIFANQTYHCDPDLHQLHRQLWRKRWELGVGISQCHTRSEHGPHQR
ncbi:MAG: hypothetical protein ALECFALPRED_005009 [Alectoria fallacina]|uniref:Uncharacterized protein n=1 Tax=Alectoria fallacina TaxID=1903189 RepID=A0A8H3FVG9_9LECA|nr:MAG: hypothetical protein ALECFALPRED_005009 [Alectoria fallacina]